MMGYNLTEFMLWCILYSKNEFVYNAVIALCIFNILNIELLDHAVPYTILIMATTPFYKVLCSIVKCIIDNFEKIKSSRFDFLYK